MSYLEFRDSCGKLYFTGGLIRSGAVNLLIAVSLAAVSAAQTAEHTAPRRANAHLELRSPSPRTRRSH